MLDETFSDYSLFGLETVHYRTLSRYAAYNPVPALSRLRASGSLADTQPGRAANVGGDPWQPQVPGHRGKADGSNEHGRRARSF